MTKLEFYRRSKGYTMGDLARASGVSVPTILNAEKGEDRKRSLQVGKMRALAFALDVSEATLTYLCLPQELIIDDSHLVKVEEEA